MLDGDTLGGCVRNGALDMQLLLEARGWLFDGTAHERFGMLWGMACGVVYLAGAWRAFARGRNWFSGSVCKVFLGGRKPVYAPAHGDIDWFAL